MSWELILKQYYSGFDVREVYDNLDKAILLIEKIKKEINREYFDELDPANDDVVDYAQEVISLIQPFAQDYNDIAIQTKEELQ
tara:strand:+ start:266 stop:514 length:249 start_codon:yes stop_codon:yes gene_type:complete